MEAKKRLKTAAETIERPRNEVETRLERIVQKKRHNEGIPFDEK